MSLPTYAIILSEDGVEIDRQFANCGWWATADTIARVLIRDIKDNGYKDTDIVHLYGVEIPVKLLREATDEADLSQKLIPLIEAHNATTQRQS